MSFKIEPLRTRVRVKFSDSTADLSRYFNAITDEEAEEITQWVTERDMGKRIAFDIWKLKSRACVTAFILHWGSK
jgi:hypothetical protein